jgi:hypothetical protein
MGNPVVQVRLPSAYSRSPLARGRELLGSLAEASDARSLRHALASVVAADGDGHGQNEVWIAVAAVTKLGITTARAEKCAFDAHHCILLLSPKCRRARRHDAHPAELANVQREVRISAARHIKLWSSAQPGRRLMPSSSSVSPMLCRCDEFRRHVEAGRLEILSVHKLSWPVCSKRFQAEGLQRRHRLIGDVPSAQLESALCVWVESCHRTHSQQANTANNGEQCSGLFGERTRTLPL